MRKFIYLAISLIMFPCCNYPWGSKQVEKLDKKYFPELRDYQTLIFKSNQLNKDTFYYEFHKEDELILDNLYYEQLDIFYCSGHVDNPYYIKKPNLYCINISIAGYIYNEISVQINTEINEYVGFEAHDFYEPSFPYQQNGHIYPDVYTFEMDTVSAMEDWDTTMNLFPDVRKVWYSLKRGIVRYDMKDGESFRLVE